MIALDAKRETTRQGDRELIGLREAREQHGSDESVSARQEHMATTALVRLDLSPHGALGLLAHTSAASVPIVPSRRVQTGERTTRAAFADSTDSWSTRTEKQAGADARETGASRWSHGATLHYPASGRAAVAE